MPATERLHNEIAFHDAQAAARHAHYAAHPEQLLLDEEAYLGHETWIRPAVELLGDIRGLRVLDCGCGHGMASVVLARRGGRVTAFDLSPWYLDEAGQRARANGVAEEIAFVRAAGERLPFAACSFDRVWGNAILHHLDLEEALPELRRVLRPGGRAVFCEPWGGNALLEWARRWAPYPGKDRSPDERPLTTQQLGLVRRYFPTLQVHAHQLAGMLRRLWPDAPFLGALDRLDAAFLRRWPGLARFCRYVVLTLFP